MARPLYNFKIVFHILFRSRLMISMQQPSYGAGTSKLSLLYFTTLVVNKMLWWQHTSATASAVIDKTG